MGPSQKKIRKVMKSVTNCQDMLSSGLSNDCLLDLFERLNHNDLDEVAVLSRRFSSLTVQARQRARRIPSTVLSIHSRDGGFVVDGGECPDFSQRFKIGQDRCDESCSICTKLILANRGKTHEIEALHQTFKFVEKVAGRFCFDSVTMFLKGYNKIFELIMRYFQISKMDYINFQVNLGEEEDIRKVADWLLSSRAEKISVDASDDYINGLVNLDFIKRASDTPGNPSLSLSNRAEWNQGNETFSVPNCRKSLEFLAKFTDLYVRTMIFDAERLMELVMVRSRLNKPGRWCVNTTQPLDVATIRAALEPNMRGARIPDSNHGYEIYVDETYLINIIAEMAQQATRPVGGWNREGYEAFIFFIDCTTQRITEEELFNW